MPAAAIVGGAVLGGAAGGQKDVNSQTTNGINGVLLAPESDLEKKARQGQETNFGIFGNLINAGANQTDVSNAAGSQRSLASLLQSYAQGNYQPTKNDITQASGLADQLFAPQFKQQGIDANRLASQLGRPINDPVLQAKLRTAQAEQKGSFVAQQAQQMPMQRLGFASQLSDVQNNLASQALSNRQAILGIGSNILGQEENFRAGTAGHSISSETVGQSGGGFKGAVAGLMGGAGAGAKMAGGLGG